MSSHVYYFQVNILKTPTSDTPTKKITSSETVVSNPPPVQNVPMTSTAKNVRGIIHLPPTPVTETVDQANQTYSGDFCATKEEGYDSEEDRRVSKFFSNYLLNLHAIFMHFYIFSVQTKT